MSQQQQARYNILPKGTTQWSGQDLKRYHNLSSKPQGRHIIKKLLQYYLSISCHLHIIYCTCERVILSGLNPGNCFFSLSSPILSSQSDSSSESQSDSPLSSFLSWMFSLHDELELESCFLQMLFKCGIV